MAFGFNRQSGYVWIHVATSVPLKRIILGLWVRSRVRLKLKSGRGERFHV